MLYQLCKQILTIRACVKSGFRAFALLAAALPALAAESVLNEVYVVDPLSGVALGGYDPVSYITNGVPLAGRPEFELVWSGVSWYFANAANRDVFARHPESYAPQFGGHGTMGLARGYLSDGNPQIYLVIGNRLFLFYSTANRDAFMLAQKPSYQKAVQNWEFLSYDLLGRNDPGPIGDEVNLGPVTTPLPEREGAPDGEGAGAAAPAESAAPEAAVEAAQGAAEPAGAGGDAAPAH